jgi:hypothetical protein
MLIYTLPILPVILLSLWSRKISSGQLVVVWLAMIGPLTALMPEGSRDYTIYLADFIDINSASLLDVIWQDPLYTTAVWLFGHAGGSGEVFYFLLSSVGLLVKLSALWRLGGHRSIVLLIYCCSYFFLHDFTQIRAGLAIGLWMHALIYFQSNRKRYYALLFIASLIHLQAALGFLLPLVFRGVTTPRRTLITSIVVLVTVATAATRLFDQIGYAVLASIPDARTQIYIKMAEEGLWVRPNPYSFISMLSLATALVGLNRTFPAFRSETIQMPVPAVYRAVFCSLLLGSCALAVLSSVSVAAFRISEHFFSVLPLGVWFVATRGGSSTSNEKYLLPLAALLCYIFLFYGSFLLDPITGVPNE